MPDTASGLPPRPRRPEVIAPAGGEEALRAAIENGADAVYFGLEDFNARLRAGNFAVAALPEITARLHERGVRAYVTLNTLIFADELEGAARLLLACSEAGVDAVMIQDLGLAALAARLAPALPVYASTQMTLTAPESVEAARALGLRIERVVAPRELTLRELRAFRRGCGVELEVFVHGALCVAYSGQCLTSEALGGRSANRGECAQACRLPYRLIVDGEAREPAGGGDVKYLLSPMDLCAAEELPALMELGIEGLKIEGRLKTPHYVAATVRAYREALDRAAAPARRLTDDDNYRLAMTFSRGFTSGWLPAINHQSVVEGRFPKKRGLYLGRVVRVERRGVKVRLEGPLKPGDGVVFDAGRPEEDEEGGRVYEILDAKSGESLKNFDPRKTRGGAREFTLTFGEGRVRMANIHPGDRVWKTSDPRMEAELAETFAGPRIRWRRPVHARFRARPGAPARLRFEDDAGRAVEVEDTEPAARAERRPLTAETLRAQLERLGGAPFELAALELELDGPVLVPFSRLNALRRRAVEALIALRRRENLGRPSNPTALEQWLAEPVEEETGTLAEPRLSALCRTLEQVEAALESGGLDTIYTDFEDPRLNRRARELIPSGGGVRFAPATLRVMKPAEAPLVRKLLEAAPDAVLVRHLAGWKILREARPDLELFGDYALNVANPLTARLLRRAGFRRLTPSYDLNAEQLLGLLAAAPPAWFEITAHQYMPLFHMEHCVFCRFLSAGTDFTNCGRPCERHAIALEDRRGFRHPVRADAGCRNTVFHAAAQSASEYLPGFLRAGARRFRVEFLEERAADVRQILWGYQAILRGEEDGRGLWRRLRAIHKLGVTRGSLDHE